MQTTCLLLLVVFLSLPVIDHRSFPFLQACGDGKTLLAALQQPVSPESFNSVIAQTDYSTSAGHILDLIHEILQRHRHLQQLWKQNWQVSSHGMQLCVFQQDAKKVTDVHLFLSRS